MTAATLGSQVEVSVVGHAGLSSDTVLSVRSGAVRKQAAISSRKSLHFPSPPESKLKVDIFKQVYTGYILLKPTEATYNLAFGDDGQERLGLKVGSAPTRGHLSKGQEAAAPESPKTEAAPKQDSMIVAARDYLEQHKVLEFVQVLLQVLIQDRPEDPFAAMADHLIGTYNLKVPPVAEYQPWPTQSSEATAYPDQGAQDANSAADASPATSPKTADAQQPIDTAAEVPPEPNVDPLCVEAREVLSAALSDGSLAKALQKQASKVAAQRLETCRLKVANVLLQSAADGRLAEAVQKETAMEKERLVSQEQDAHKERPTSQEALRAEVCGLVCDAVADGRVVSMLDETATEDMKPAMEEGPLTDSLQKEGAIDKERPTSQEALRAEVCGLVCDAVADGRMDSMLKETAAIDARITAMEQVLPIAASTEHQPAADSGYANTDARYEALERFADDTTARLARLEEYFAILATALVPGVQPQ